MTLKIRLYFSKKIQSDLVSHLTPEQSHYVRDVMRLKKGDYLSVFNTQGEWCAIIENYEKEGAKIKILKKVRDKDNEKNIWLAFSPIKQNSLNFLIQKGTELGVQKFIPVLTERSIEVKPVKKVLEGRPHIVDAITNNEVDLIFNTTEGSQAIADSFTLRRSALLHQIPYYTTISGAKSVMQAINYIKQHIKMEN